MRGLLGEKLLRRPVRFNGIELGRSVDVLLDPAAARVVGLEVACGDDGRRFLPLAAVSIHDDSIAISSPLLLLDEEELRFYRDGARTLRALRGVEIERQGRRMGALRDVVLGESGSVEHVVLEGEGEMKRMPRHGLDLSNPAAAVAPTSAPRRS